MAEKLVTITNSGITMTIPEKEVSIYTRAGYKVVPVEIEAVKVEPEPVEVEAVKKNAKK